MVKQHPFFVMLGLALLVLGSGAARAQWAADGNVIRGASTTSPQLWPRLVSDGAGGALVVMESHGYSDINLHAQRVDAAGGLPWGAAGVAICTETGDQVWADLVADGAGGAILTWSDARNVSTYSVYVQRIDGAGAVQWGTDGREVNYGASQSHVALDGTGGAYVAWTEAATYPTSIAVQRLTAGGTTAWPDYVVAGTGNSSRLVGDGAGGLVAGWQQYAGGTSRYYVRGQRLGADGVLQWPGVAVSPGYGCDFDAPLAGDGAGGGIWAWQYYSDVFVQRMDAAGAAQWGAGGLQPLAGLAAPNQARLVSDGAGGAIVVVRDGVYDSDLYANRILANGTLAWSAAGVVVCAAAGTAQVPQLAPDGQGGAYIVWQDDRNDPSYDQDIYAQHLDADGDALWAAGGVAICTAAGNQTNPQVTATGNGSAIIAWEDRRTGPTDVDVYAQAVHLDGSIGDPPFVVTTTLPAVNAVDVPPSVDIYATFNGNLDPATALAANVTVHGSLTGLRPGTVTYNATTRTLRIGYKFTSFAPGEVLTVSLSDRLVSATGDPLTPMVWSFTVAAEGFAGEFLAATSYAVGTSPIGMCAADIDGDGDVDLVSANYTEGTISIRRGNGNGTFGAETALAAGPNPHGVCAADLDRDGDLDLVVANYTASQVSVLRNGGTGNFPVTNTYATGNGPESVCAVDLDGDGYLDLATANLAADNVSVLLNTGHGTFGPAVNIAAGDNPIFITAGDLDGDGFADLATANLLSDDISVFLNKGTGLMAPRTDINAGDGANTVHAADLDGDGDLDLVAAAGTGNRMVVFRNRGDGTFAVPTAYSTGAAPYAGCPADVDGDGDLDLLYANANSDNVAVRLNNGTGSFGGQALYPAGDFANALVAADFDGDRALDLATVNRYSNDFTVLLNHASLSGVEDGPVPTVTALGRNVPNPFNPATRIDYAVAEAGPVRLTVHDARGRVVAVLVDERQEPGARSVRWDGRDGDGGPAASGVYFYRLETGGCVETGKMALVR